MQTWFYYTDFSDVSKLCFVDSATTITDGATFVRLVNEASSFYQRGAVWYATKQDISLGFVTTFKMRITTTDSTAVGDGLAFVLQDEGPTAIGINGGGIGYEGIQKSLAVEFDVYTNQPSLTNCPNSACNDPNNNHIAIRTQGVNLNSSAHYFNYTTDYSADWDVPLVDIFRGPADGQTHTVKIIYVPGIYTPITSAMPSLVSSPTGTIRVFINDFPVLSRHIDITPIIGTFAAPKPVYVGFTAATGANRANHEITEWTFVRAVDQWRVKNFNDSGTGSLRDILNQGAGGAPERLITFVPSAAATIQPLSAFDITNPVGNVVIDASAVNGLTLDGSAARSRAFFVDLNRNVTIGSLTMQNFLPRNGEDGGAILNQGRLILTNTKLSNNRSSSTRTLGGRGGAIFNVSASDNEVATLVLDNAQFENNVAERSGGAIFNYRRIVAKEATFYANQTSLFGSEGHGGAISQRYDTVSYARLTAYRSTFENNRATSGGGIFAADTSVFNAIINSTFANNIATRSAGSAVASQGSGLTNIINSTIAFNKMRQTASTYGAIYGGGDVFLRNTIVADSGLTEGESDTPVSGASPNCFGSGIFDEGTNLSTDNSCPFGPTSFKNTPAGFAFSMLVDDGGQTKTLPLLATSAAVNAGNNMVCVTSYRMFYDQRGPIYPRSQGPCDIGSFEFVP
jgi:predicted outer membrane repeat protein